jgi:hypothetical protein
MHIRVDAAEQKNLLEVDFIFLLGQKRNGFCLVPLTSNSRSPEFSCHISYMKMVIKDISQSIFVQGSFKICGRSKRHIMGRTSYISIR